MCYTYATRPYCHQCRQFVKDAEEEKVIERICPVNSPCKYRSRRPLPRSPRVEVVTIVCADCSWKRAREIFASSTAAEKSNLPTNATASPPEAKPIPRNLPIDAHGSHVRVPSDGIDPAIAAMDEDAEFEEQASCYLGDALRKEIGDQKNEPAEVTAKSHSPTPSLASGITASSTSTQASCPCCSPQANPRPKSQVDGVKFAPRGAGVPGAPTMPKADRIKAAAAAARAASTLHPGAAKVTPAPQASHHRRSLSRSLN